MPYLEDAGPVYFAEQPVDSAVGAKLMAVAKAGTAPYSFQWYKDDKQVVNVPEVAGELVSSEPGQYFVVATDAGGEQTVSRAAVIA